LSRSQVQQSDQANRNEIYEKTYEVLRPEVKKMKDLMAFCDQSVQLCRRVLEALHSDQRKLLKTEPSEEYLLTLARILNLFLVIDALKNMKTSMTNDFAIYKR